MSVDQEIYRTLFESAADAIMLLTEAGQVRQANQTALAMFACEADDLIGQPFAHFAPPTQPDGTESAVYLQSTIAATAQQEEQVEMVCQRADGEQFTAQLVLRAITTPNERLIQTTLHDITEYKQIQSDLQHSEGQYRLLLEASPDPIAIYDMSGAATYVNTAFVETFGWSREELLGKRIDFVPEEHQTETQWAIQEMFKSGRVPLMDTRRYTKSGKVLDVQLSAALFTDDDNQPEGIIVILRDVTTHKETEAARRESEERYHTILSNTVEGYYEVDLEGDFTFCNEALAEVFGWPREELIGKNYTAIMDEETAVIVRHTFRQVYKTGAPGSGDDWPIIGKDGSVHIVNSSISLIKNAQGKPIGCRGVIRDMTERRRTEQMLNQFKMGIERSRDAVFLTDTEGVIRYVNPAFTEIYGYAAEDVLGKTPRILKSGEMPTQFYNELWGRLLDGEVVSKEVINRTKDGRLLTIEVSNNPIEENGRLTGFLSIQRDITARKRAEEALQQTHEQLEARIEARTSELIDANVSLTEEIVERTVAEEELKLGYENQAILNQLLQLSIGEGTLEDMLEEAFGIIISTPWFATLPQGSIFLAEPDEDVLVLKAKNQLNPILQNRCSRIAFGECLCGRAASTKEIQFANCVNDDHEIRYDGMVEHGHYNVPIIFDEQLVGVLNLYVEHGHKSNEQEVAFLNAVANTLANLIQRERARAALQESQQQLRDRAESLAAINRVADAVYQALDQEQVLSQAASAIATYANAPAVALYLLDADAQRLELLATEVADADAKAEALKVGDHLPLEGSLSGLAVQNKAIMVSRDIGEDDRLEPEVKDRLVERGLEHVISVPIMFQDEVLGVVNLIYTDPPRFTEQEQETLLSIGKTIGLALSNAQYVAQIQREIEERQQAEEALLASEIQTRAIISTALDAVIAIDHEATVTTWNPQAEAVFGWTAVEAIGQTLTDLIVPPRHREGHNKGMERYLSTGVKHILDQRIEIEALHRDGHEFPIELSISEIKLGDTSIFSAFARDITQRKAAENTVRRQEQEAREFQQKLQALQSVNIELSRAPSLDELYRQVIVQAKERLGFDRIGLLLYEEEAGTIKGTFGTDAEGNISDEREMHLTLDEANLQILLRQQPAELRENVPLWSGTEQVGEGWNAITGIWVDDRGIGWLAADNLTTRQPPSPYQLEILTLYGVAVGNLINRKQAEQEIRESLTRRSQQMEVATRVAQEIARAVDIQDLYQQVVTLVKEEFDFYHVQLLRYDPARDHVALVTGYGDVGAEMLAQRHALPAGVGLIGTAVMTGQSMLRSNVAEDPHWKPNKLLPHTKSELAVPIKLRDNILGVLDVQSDVRDGLTTEDQIVLEGLCGQIATAIESLNLRQEMELRLDELNVLQRQMTREGWDTYQATRRQAVGYLFDRQALHPLTAETAVVNGKQKNSNGEGGTAVSTPDLITPLQVRGETVGLIGIEQDESQPLTDNERTFLDAISQQIAEALEAARLFEQTQASLAEQERLASELETVAEVSTAASTILETDKLLQSVVDLVKNSFNLYHAQIYLYDERQSRLILRAGADTVGRLMTLEGQEINPYTSDSPIVKAALQREGIIVNNLTADPKFSPHPLLPNTQAELVVPFIVGDKVIGVMDLQSDKQDYFTSEDMQIQNTLGAQIAIAVQNATLYAEQVAATEKLREVDRLKSEFLASMSHELRTPLNSIIGFADVILEGLDGPLTERMEEDISLIKGSGIHLRELIGDILDMSKIEAGRMELRYETLDVAKMVSEVVATNQPLAEEKQLYLKANIAPDIPHVEADRTRLRQVFYNIISNAIKFTQKGGVTVNLTMKGDFVQVAIQDTGIGIKAEDAGIVFEQFRQIDGSLNRQVGGTGLGMPITKNLVELHGGEIWIESTVGVGTTFIFTIPRYKSPPRGDAARNLVTL